MKSVGDRVRKRIQRACDCAGAGCASCGGAQRSPRGEAPAAVPQAAYEVLRTPGEPLDDAVRREHETKLGHDLGDVRVHAAPTESVAGTAASEMNAHAFTVGQHIVMADDAPQANGPDGRKLLDHELTHVVEHQPRLDMKHEGLGMLDMQPTDSADEREAGRAGSLSDEESEAAETAATDEPAVDDAESLPPAAVEETEQEAVPPVADSVEPATAASTDEPTAGVLS